MVVAQKNDGPCLRFLKKVIFEGGERETDLWVHALFEITLVFFFFFFSFLFFLFSFLSFFFSLLLCFFLSLRKCALFFHPPFRARLDPFYSACRG